jgi:alpha/beta superfamily hydrolase
MARRIESLLLSGNAGKIEALLEEPEEGAPVEAAVVCHPHPQFGGTMHNKVVYRLARGLRKAGCVVLRFNYRGVNLSEGTYDHGIGETDDARVALHELQSRYSGLQAMVAGFSFGSRVALRLSSQETSVRRVFAVGFPTRISGQDYVQQVRIPKFFIQSTIDEFGPRQEMETFFSTVPDPKELRWIEAQDHFFAGALDVFEKAVEEFGRRSGVS